MSAFVQAWDVHFLPLKPLVKLRRAGSLVQVFGDDFQYSYSSFANPQFMSGAVPNSLVTFNVMEPSARRYWVRGHDVGSDMAWVFPVGSELNSLSPVGFQVHTLSVSEERIEETGQSLAIPVPRKNRRPEVFRLHKEVLTSVLGCLRNLRDSGDTPPANIADTCLSLLISAWLTTEADRENDLSARRASHQAVARSLSLIDHESFGKVPLSSLLEAANVSARCLQYAFRDRFGVTPGAFIKARNLARVKVMLLEADPEVSSVSGIATMHGFWHVGQFAADYRRQFGELPSETLLKTKP